MTRVQAHELQNEAAVAVSPKLAALERSMLTWAMIERGDKVLDMSPRYGTLLGYVARHMECEICGLSGDMENVKQVRTRLKNADILYSNTGDIPWRENSFHVIFMQRPKHAQDDAELESLLTETLRVLKPGGQFLMAAVNYPTPFRQIANVLQGGGSEMEQALFGSKERWLVVMRAAGYRGVTWQQFDFTRGIAIGWKPVEREN